MVTIDSGATHTQISNACDSAWQQALDHIDGREYVLDGIHGVIKVDQSRAFETRIWHEPSDEGRNTRAYRDMKRQLGDHWSSDLSQSERLADIMMALGVDWG